MTLRELTSTAGFRLINPFCAFLTANRKHWNSSSVWNAKIPIAAENSSVYTILMSKPLPITDSRRLPFIKGMLQILPLLSYYDLINELPRPKKVQANYYHDINGERHQELLMKLTLPSPLPRPLSGTAEGCYFKGEGPEASLRVPLYEEEMKYFYSNYKNYYYLPEEDTIHKSVSSYVDKKHRVQATASTCYTRKLSTYLPQWDILFQPFFKRNYEDRDIFFELTEEMKKERRLFSEYAGHIINMIAGSYIKS